MKNKPVCYEPNQIRPELYPGIPTFIGLPAARTKEEIKGHDFCIMGTPWEGTSTFNGINGADTCTQYIRAVSSRYSGYLPDFDFDIFDEFSGCDYGDCATKHGDREFTFRSVENYVTDILDAGAIPIIFGGDHGLSYPQFKAFARHYDGKVGLIHFDAHMDNCETFGDDPYARCCPFHRCYDIEGFDPKHMVSVGIRGPRNHYKALQYAREAGASVITAWESKEIGIKETIRRAIDIASDGTEAFYVTVCSDALDVANNLSGPNDHCGFTTYELAYMLHECGLNGCKGFDFMEVLPCTDVHNASSHGACWMAIYMMSGMAARLLRERGQASSEKQ